MRQLRPQVHIFMKCEPWGGIDSPHISTMTHFYNRDFQNCRYCIGIISEEMI